MVLFIKKKNFLNSNSKFKYFLKMEKFYLKEYTNMENLHTMCILGKK